MYSSRENKCEKGNESPRTREGIDRLPREVSVDIISRLPITSLIPIRYVSKSWKKLTYDPHLINLHLSRSAKNTTYLIFHSSEPSSNHLCFVEFSDHNENQHVRKFQLPFPIQMSEINVVGSCNGLLCLSNSKDHEMIHIFNPFTQSYKQLPESRKFNDQKVVVGFGFNPLTKYKVVRIVYYQNVNEQQPHQLMCRFNYTNSQSEVQVYTVGSNDWRSIGNIPYIIDSRMSKYVFVNGRLHWLTISDPRGGHAQKIISFDLADEQFKEVPPPDWVGIMMYPYPFTVLGDCLSLLVYPRHGNIDIWVMKEYGVKDSWSKDFEIDVNGPIPRGPLTLTLSIHFSSIQVLCLTKNGGILLMRYGALTFYDPESRKLKNVAFKGMQKCVQIVLHVGSLVSLENV